MAPSKRRTPVTQKMPAAIPGAVLVVLIAIGVFFTGCTVQYGLDTKVEVDGSGSVGIRLAADKELQEGLSSATEGLGGLGDLGSLGDLGGLGDLGALGSILGGLGDIGILEDLGTLGRILGALGALNDLTGELPTTVDELFNAILGRIPGDWQVERGTDGSGTRWVSLTRSFSELEELKQIMSESVISSIVPMDEFYITQDKGFFGTKTVFSTSLDPADAMSGAQGGASSLPADLLETVLAIQNRLTLPGDIKDNNADLIEGNTLVWNIGLSGKTEMYGESVDRNWGAIIGVIVGAVVILALIVVAVLLLLRRRRRSRSSPSRPTEGEPKPTTAQAAGQGGGIQAQPDVGESAGPAGQTAVTEVRSRAAIISPPSDDVPPPAVMAAAASVAGAAAGAAVATPPEEETPVEASADETSVPDAAAGDETHEETTAGETAPAVDEEPAAGEDAPQAGDLDPAAGGTGEEAAAPAGVAAKPPTPIPFRPSRLPAQETADEAARDMEDSAGGEAFDEPPATHPGEEVSEPS